MITTREKLWDGMLYPTHIQCPVVRLRRFIRPKISQTSHKPFSHALHKLFMNSGWAL